MIESVEFDDVTKVLAILFGAFVFTMTVFMWVLMYMMVTGGVRVVP
jgi:hypothetical protein